MTTPFFSIIIPTYNSAKTLSTCLDSLIDQTFQNFEIIILDGKSSDDTISISLHYTGVFKNIRLISEKDKGIYYAMNKGIEMSNGRWLYFLGSDDYLLNNSTLEKIIEFGDLDNFDFVYGDVLSPEYGDHYDGDFDQQKILNKNICHQALFVRRDLFHRLGKFNTRYKQLADYDFNLRAIFNNKIRKKHIELTIAYYAPGGSSSVKTDEKFVKDKDYLVLKYGFRTYNWTHRIRLLKNLLKKTF
jgi:glycosyltransferase involved in cell wall biosynthesis